MAMNSCLRVIMAVLLLVQGGFASKLVLETCTLGFLDAGKMPIKINNIEESYEITTVVQVSLSDTLQLSFVSDESLEQAHVLVGDPENALEMTYKPVQKYIEESSSYLYKFNIPLPRISKYLKNRDELMVTLLAANTDSTIFKSLFKLEVENPVVYESELVSRLTAEKQIFHIFQEPAKTVATHVGQAFSLVIVAIFAVLLFSWLATGLVSLRLSSIYSYLFVACLVGFEYIFVQYYMGQSIFTTLFHLSWIGLPALFIGSRALRFSKAL